eukprot:CAMPEP_0201515204 /NCGR_PEP_ID=MMETSP0161_2-20130828/6832_1 /ASSEMBLY_ACC=CAM_ASM_000251 /TAXON_ID=180227 /ORGANISM="Neoparamoeba aestuarina, Strain SoJaBio B1-5/56/2" /LENGTH=1045 /DNA_ID=CAMNT_0047911971 /DNA_START=44 /DNA_END=3184 /DNA_ORIENTATION=+
MADHQDESLSGDETERETASSRRQQSEYDASTVVILDLTESRHQAGGIYTDPFMVGDHKWRLYYFPIGNKSHSFSVYIEALEEATDYKRDAKFRMTPKNHLGKECQQHVANHNFTRHNKDWGFTDFVRLEDLYDPQSGYLEDGRFHILVETKVHRTHEWSTRDETGYIGLFNQGATCYMNSLLQALFHLPYFRRVVYKMPAEEGKGVTIPYALQALFYRLQTSSNPVSTKQLTKSFGWEDDDSFSQHDVTEFNRVLIDTLEMKMKGTSVEGTMEKLFRGEFINYIQCINVAYKSERPEYFYDLQMPIEGCKDIYESFRKYVLPETLSGDNKYQAEGHGLQDANRGIRFKTFPDVLELNLNRFKQDFFMDRITKINDRFEFYTVIDLKEFFSENDTESSVYHLHGVLVHSGTMQGGHYNAYLRPTEGPEWYRFDDSSVRKTKEGVAVDDNFGESADLMRTQTVFRKFSSAYMLIYVRDSRVKEIFNPVLDSDIPPFLIERLQKEQAEMKRLEEEKEEAERCVDVGVVTQEMLIQDKQEKFDMLWLGDVPKIRVRKEMTLGEFRAKYAEDNGIDNPEKIRLWDWISRKNKTERVEYPLTRLERPMRTLDLFHKQGPPFIRFFVEISDKEEAPFFKPVVHGTDVITFFKYFDLENQKLRHIGHALFERSDPVESFLPIARKLAGLPETLKVRLHEEVKPLRIDQLEMGTTLKQSELVTGDIIIVENDFPEEERSRFDNPHVGQFFRNILDRVVVQFRPMDEPDDEANYFTLVLNKTMPYEEVAKRVADKVGWPQNKIRLGDSSKVSRSAPIPVEYSLQKILARASPAETLYFRKMEMTIEEFLQLRRVNVQFWEGARRYSNVELLVKKEATCADVVALLGKEVTLKGTKKIRLMISHDGFLEDIPPPDYKVDKVYLSSLVAEEVAEEELELAKGDLLMKVMHYDSYCHRFRDSFHGVPFFILIKKNDTFGDVKDRIRKRLKVKKEEFGVWKFALIEDKSPSVIPHSTPEDTPFSKFLGGNIMGIALEHRRREKSYGGGWKEKGISFKS